MSKNAILAFLILAPLSARAAVIWWNPTRLQVQVAGADTADAWVSSLIERCPGATDVPHTVAATVDMLGGLQPPNAIPDDCAWVITVPDGVDIHGTDGSSQAWSVFVAGPELTVTKTTSPATLAHSVASGTPAGAPVLVAD
ncbi:MAG: hypothetical protein KTR31_29525 [Myxococcales bacterium]|nr:hypothetical protein [Myxococcales bacterium]